MSKEKGVGKTNSEFEQKKDKVVELPVLDFFKINKKKKVLSCKNIELKV